MRILSSKGGFCVINLGCKVNRVESDSFAAFLLSRGMWATNEQEADLIVVNTCTVTHEAAKKSRKAVRHAVRVNRTAQILVTGCASALDAAGFSSINQRITVVLRKTLEPLVLEHVRKQAASRSGDGFKTRVSIKIQDGCDHACSFCIVHKARGAARSRPLQDILDEVKAYDYRGVKELVLVGIDLGAWQDGEETLATLLQEILIATSDCKECDGPPLRIRLSSIEPCSITDELINVLLDAQGRVCRHLHIPVQSGSSKVLHEMGRLYDADDYYELVNRLFKNLPRLSLSTDIIVGFPGETDEDFRQTLSLAKTCQFSRVHVFPYSVRPGTPAAERTDQVADEIKARRAKEMRMLASNLQREDYDHRVGMYEYVLVEDNSALTESYHEIPVPFNTHPGELVAVALPARYP